MHVLGACVIAALGRVVGVILTGAAVVVGVLALVWLFQRTLIYFPVGNVPPARDFGLPQAEAVTFQTTDGLTLHGWFVPTSWPRSTYTVVVFNGNAGHRAYRAPLAVKLQQYGFQVLLFDYRGYGDNGGTPTETGLRADAEAARRYLAERGDVDLSRLVYFGESLGTAVAVGLAATHPPAGVILRSPFASLVELGRTHYPFLPVRLLLLDRFAAIDDIGRVTSPVLVLAGDRDRIVPLDQSRRLYDKVRSPKELVVLAGADHNDVELLAGDEMLAAITRFTRHLTPTHE